MAEKHRSVHEIELDDSIIELSRHIGKDYKRLARALGIYKTDIEAIEYRDPRDLKEQIYEFFEFWKQKEGMNASVGQLMWGLEKAELSEVLEKMKTFTKGKDIIERDEDEAVIIEAVQPSQPVSIDKPTDHRRKSHSLDVSAQKFLHWRHYSEGTRSPSLYSTDMDEGEHIQLVFETTGGSCTSVQRLQKTNTSIETIGDNKFKIIGRIQYCCKTLHALLQNEERISSRICKNTISIENHDQWGMVVGHKGCINKAIVKLSGAKVRIEYKKSYPKTCYITGFCKQVKVAERLLQRAMNGEDVVAEATPENVLARLKDDLNMCGFKFEAHS